MSVRSENENMSIGNAAAMREALGTVLRYLQWLYAQGCTRRDRLSDEIDRVVSALSAPPRNCDVCKTPEDCMRAFESYVREHGKLGFINPFTEVVKWLLAPAERKGEGK